MKLLTLWEPWATFMALGYKRWETRCWRTHYRGPIAIHAAQLRDHVDDAGLILTAAGIKKSIFDPDPFPTGDGDWPFGKVLAVARLADCVQTEDANPSAQERELGDYSPERFAWKFEDLRRVKPIHCKGMQGLKDLPPDVEAKLEYLEAAAGARP